MPLPNCTIVRASIRCSLRRRCDVATGSGVGGISGRTWRPSEPLRERSGVAGRSGGDSVRVRRPLRLSRPATALQVTVTPAGTVGVVDARSVTACPGSFDRSCLRLPRPLAPDTRNVGGGCTLDGLHDQTDRRHWSQHGADVGPNRESSSSWSWTSLSSWWSSAGVVTLEFSFPTEENLCVAHRPWPAASLLFPPNNQQSSQYVSLLVGL